MNKIGFNVLAWSAAISEALKPIAGRLKEVGYDGVKFLVGLPYKAAYKSLGEYTKDLGLELLRFLCLSSQRRIETKRSKGFKLFKAVFYKL